MSGLDDILGGLMGGQGGSGGLGDAQQLGVSESQAADAVAQALPEVVDKISPQGQLLPEQDLDAAFDKLSNAGAK